MLMLNMKIHTKILKKIACIGQRLMYPIMEKRIIPYHATFFLNAIKFLGIYIKNSNKRLFFNQKYNAKISNPITKPQFFAIIKLTYTENKQKKKDRSPN